MTMALIQLDSVSKIYGFGDATTLALDEVSLTIEKGEFVAVMGPSGCGKSTLMNVIGLIDRPSHGTYKLDEKLVSHLRAGQLAKFRRDSIGFVFQSFNLLPRLTVLENVALPLLYKGFSLTKRVKLASQMLERVGIQKREYYLPNQLSGGQTQSAAIARALVNNPSIIIADEPTGNLDSANSRMVMGLLADIHKLGSTVIFVTHNPELTRYATRVVYMHDGGIMHDEKTALGKVADRARAVMYSLPKSNLELVANDALKIETQSENKLATKRSVKKKSPKARKPKKSKVVKVKS